MQGLFITFEGADGSGKTTQIKLLAEQLATLGYEVVVTREPGGTLAAEQIRTLVLSPDYALSVRTELLLYLAARAEHVAQVIAPALAAGKVVLCDRFSDSSLVYQGIVRGLGVEAVRLFNSFATAGLEPNLTFLLDAAPEDLLARRMERGTVDRFELEGVAFQRKVREGFLQLAAEAQGRIIVINALESVEVIRERIATAMRGLRGLRVEGKRGLRVEG